jgi:hypothetical protein
MNKQIARFLLLSIFVTALFTGCVPVIPADPPLAASATPAPTPEVLADCFQSATALAWLDENGNGEWDEGEAPLAGIEFVLEPTVYSRTTSDEDGVADIFATTPGGICPENQQVIAVGFDGYTLTTAQSLAYLDDNTDYAFGFQPSLASNHIDADSYTGVIFPAEKTAEFITWFGAPADSFWTPTEEDVANLEAGLVAFLQESNNEYNDTTNMVEALSEYTRQYFGLVQADEELIFANFFCETRREDWEETAVVVLDGGDCYFQVIYNASANTFISLSINGEA